MSLYHARPVDKLVEYRLFKKALFVFLVDHIDALPQVLVHLVNSQLVESDEVAKAWVTPNQINIVFPPLKLIFTATEQHLELVFIEGDLGSFLEKVARDNSPFDTPSLFHHFVKFSFY